MAYDPVPRDLAAGLARQALDRDLRSGLAWRVLAWVAWWHVYQRITASVRDTLAHGIDAAARAIAIDASDHHARRLRAKLHFMTQNSEAGLTELRLAHELNPNCALTMCWLGLYEAISGDQQNGASLAEAGVRRSPRDPALGSMLCAVGFANFAARNYAATAVAAEAALAEAADGATPLILGTIAYVGIGQIDKAAEMFRQVELIAPKLVEARLAGRWLSSDPDYLSRAHMFFRIAGGLAPLEAA